MRPEASSTAGSAEPPRQGGGLPAAREGGETTPATSDRSPSFWRRHRRALTSALWILAALGFFYYVVPRIVGLGPTLRLLRRGDIWWLALGIPLEALSYAGEIVLFRGVFATPETRIGWTASYDIDMAGTAATKLFAAGGAGGIALTVWALHGYGLSGTEVANGMVCYELLTYGVYMAAMAIAGYGIWFGLFAGRAPVGLTLVPAVFATAVIVVALSMLWVDKPVEAFLQRRAERSRGRKSRWWGRLAALPRSIHAGLLGAIAMVKRRDPSLLGALAGWGFDIAVLWASFRAFGHSPPAAVVVMGYYVGTLANVLPWPGGVGGVEGGMIGAFLGFGIQRQLTVLAVLAYRTISYWLPTIPGAISYWRLRRQLRSSPRAADAPDPRG
ncbi:MAG: lysylphosphatidylglycerol synthase transmembrane domain-containing protein [Solirubrobacteraceae bacterium]